MRSPELHAITSTFNYSRARATKERRSNGEKEREKDSLTCFFRLLFWDSAFQEGTDVYYFLFVFTFWQEILLLWHSCLFSGEVQTIKDLNPYKYQDIKKKEEKHGREGSHIYTCRF